MTDRAVEVFGALRFADEHELDIAMLAVRCRMPWRHVALALRELCALGLVERRRVSARCRLFRLANGA